MTDPRAGRRTPRRRPRPDDQHGHPATRHLPAHISQKDGLPFYLERDGRFLAQPCPQSSLVHDVSPAEYYPERSEAYLHPVRTTEFRDYEIFDDESRMLRDAALAPGPGLAKEIQLPLGGRLPRLSMDVDNLQAPSPGPGSYNPNLSEAAVTTQKSPCVAGWRQSPAPTPTEVSMVEGAKTAGPGAFLGLAKPNRVGSVSWGSGVAGRFDVRKDADQTGPLLGPGTYSNVLGNFAFGKGGKSTIIRAKHGTTAMMQQLKAGNGAQAQKSSALHGESKVDGKKNWSQQKKKADRERTALMSALKQVREQIVAATIKELQLDRAIEAKKEEFLRAERIRRRKQLMRRAGISLGNVKKGFGFSNVVLEAFDERKRHDRIQKRYREMKSRRKTASSEISDLVLKKERLERAIEQVPRYVC